MRILSDLIQYFQGTFPNQKAQNATTTTSRDGTEWNKALIDDYILGPTQALIDAAGLVPNGQAESPNVSQYVEAISIITSQWRKGLKYIKGSKVLFAGAWQIATEDHTAETANAPDQAGSPWENYDIHQLKLAYPVGSIYANASRTENPSVYLGFGIWAAIPAGHAVAALGDGLTLEGTVIDQLQDHRHYYGISANGSGNNLYHSKREYLAAGYTDSSEVNHYESIGGIGGVHSSFRTGAVTRGKRFGANIWQRIS